jgi:hypothetical protein
MTQFTAAPLGLIISFKNGLPLMLLRPPGGGEGIADARIVVESGPKR